MTLEQAEAVLAPYAQEENHPNLAQKEMARYYLVQAIQEYLLYASMKDLLTLIAEEV